MTTTPPSDLPEVRVLVRGPVGDALREVAIAKLRALAAGAPRPVLFERLDLEVRADPGLERPAVAKATLDVSGRPVGAHVARPTMDEAVDLLVDRLRRNLRRLADRREQVAHRSALAEPGEWRHGDLPTARPEYFPRPPEERELRRRKSYAVARLTPEEAAFEMGLLEYDFHLFVDAASGADCVIHRLPDGDLALVSPSPDVGRGPAGEPAELRVEPAREMSLADALDLLDESGAPFVAFVDRGRLNVAYLRYDGHHGLLSPDGG